MCWFEIIGGVVDCSIQGGSVTYLRMRIPNILKQKSNNILPKFLNVNLSTFNKIKIRIRLKWLQIWEGHPALIKNLINWANKCTWHKTLNKFKNSSCFTIHLQNDTSSDHIVPDWAHLWTARWWVLLCRRSVYFQHKYWGCNYIKWKGMFASL